MKYEWMISEKNFITGSIYEGIEKGKGGGEIVSKFAIIIIVWGGNFMQNAYQYVVIVVLMMVEIMRVID